MKRSSALVAVVLTATLVLTACGDDDDDVAAGSSTTIQARAESGQEDEASHEEESHEAAADRTIEVDIVENAFKPSSFTVHAGETVKFVFHNEGKLIHEPILGDAAQHAEHERKMRELGQKMEHDEHQKPIAPGKTTEVTHTFQAGEKLLFGCHLPGHFDAGEKATIFVI